MSEDEEYFRMIESHFLQKRGHPALLSPKEWSLIHEWYEEKIPAEVVIRAIDRIFEKKKDEDEKVFSLRYCRRPVKSEYKKYLKSLGGAPAASRDAGKMEAQNVQEYLQRLVDLLQQSSRQASEAGNRALSDLLLQGRQKLQEEILEPLRQNTSKDLQRVEEQLTTMEKGIEQLLLQTISESQLGKLKEEVMRELKPFEGKLDLPVYQEMVRRSLIKAVRKQYDIPRLSLFYM